MKKSTALKLILGISIAGMLFSGYLSYGELIKNTCSFSRCLSVIGLPACVYGFVMYLIVFIISLLGLRSKN
ncbi:hypothetical protein J4403_00620 [Candidatus Woesearchaeota archaeon]|nr:hypothetical protein [Candidatus Woesearchaeota archaeon]